MGDRRLYENLSPEDFEEIAKQTFGTRTPPIDVEQFKKYLKRGTRILEIGCGTGRVGIALIHHYQYVGIDRHEPYLNIFRKKLSDQKNDYRPEQLISASIEEFQGDGTCFDAVIFSWAIITEFDEKTQFNLLKKVYDLLCDDGICLLENPAPGEKYNRVKYYDPVPFYYTEWQEELIEIGFSHWAEIYETETGRKRELTILKKT